MQTQTTPLTTKPTRGGAGRGQGRKPLSPEERKARKRERALRTKSIVLTQEEIAEVEALAEAAGISVHSWLVAAVRQRIADGH